MMTAYKCRNNILVRIREIIDYMIFRHNKVLPVTLVIRFPDMYRQDGSNDEIQNLLKNLMRFFSYHHIDMMYVAVREQNRGANPHYHLLILVDGNKQQNEYAAFLLCKDLWAKIITKRLVTDGLNPLEIAGIGLEGLVHRCESIPGFGLPPLEMIRRPSGLAEGEKLADQQWRFTQTVDNAFEHASYLAKEFSKGNAPDGTRELLASQVPGSFR